MIKNFINRFAEIKELNIWSKKSKLIVLYGRRRVGKTYLLRHWLGKKSASYVQAIEAEKQVQIDQVMQDLSGVVKTNLRPTTWTQFFEIIEKTSEKMTLCIDEFPYLVISDPSLPSVLQKWIDHTEKKNILIILNGSSQQMMRSLFLNETSALFSRADRILKIEPMNYSTFCKFCGLKKSDINSFVKYSLVGGIPKYWNYIDKKTSFIELADQLYFSALALLETEPRRVMTDEKVDGLSALSILELIGRGVHKPGEIASRMSARQTTLSKVFQQLLESSLIIKETPFGKLEKDSKSTLYKLADPMLQFWFGVYSPHRSRWINYTKAEKEKLVYDHASRVFEFEIRKSISESKRYWDSTVEFDCVYQNKKKIIHVCEIKFKKLTSVENLKLQNALKIKIQNLGKASPVFKDQSVEATVLGWTEFVKILKD
jgi:uncharacterized protein